jgi:transposase
MALRLRTLTDEEQGQLEELRRSRTAEARQVERARIIWEASQGERVPVIAKRLRVGQDTVREWLKRFNAHGLEGLKDKPRTGAPPTYTPEQVAEVLATAATDPQTLGQPFGSWTLDRLETYLHEVKQIPIKRSRIDELLIADGLRWRTQETWFGARVDPAFAEKRGRSSGCAPCHPRTA